MLGQLGYCSVTLDGGKRHLRLEGRVWFRRGRLFIVSPVHADYRRRQAEILLIDLFKFAGPALSAAYPHPGNG